MNQMNCNFAVVWVEDGDGRFVRGQGRSAIGLPKWVLRKYVYKTASRRIYHSFKAQLSLLLNALLLVLLKLKSILEAMIIVVNS